MQYSSRTGDNLLDLFGGSGSTLMAAEQAGRHAFLMELDPPYCDVIVERWQKFTGRKAERISAGVTERPAESQSDLAAAPASGFRDDPIRHQPDARHSSQRCGTGIDF